MLALRQHLKSEVTLRHIAFDTEATDRAAWIARPFELAMVEFDLSTGKSVSERCWKMNPGVSIPPEVERVTGMTNATARQLPKLTASMYREALAFAAGARVYIHNRSYDEPLFDKIATELGLPRLRSSAAEVVCTLQAARQAGCEPARLDDVCDQFSIDRSHRGIHSALVDCRLLARVVSVLMAPERDRMGQMPLALNGSLFAPAKSGEPLPPPERLSSDAQHSALFSRSNRQLKQMSLNMPLRTIARQPAETGHMTQDMSHRTASVPKPGIQHAASERGRHQVNHSAAAIPRVTGRARINRSVDDERLLLQRQLDLASMNSYKVLQQYVAIRGWKTVCDGWNHIGIEVRPGVRFDVTFEFANPNVKSPQREKHV